ncbi:tyrosine-type recombinase/integrase [Thalassotalea crassostreae]|uniref:tyrosine-type recombinase/integrase n=1 Tax=Thalassotalea crassostreae TaxID=1763536 RepID=UPI0008389F85|nr:integrase arm-type DNA-binding domain-containing protein [Thalassotalea crassostreae]
MKFQFTVSSIKKIEPQDKEIVYTDEGVKALKLRVHSSGRKVFILQKRIPKGKLVKVTLGTFPEMTPDQARKQATKTLYEIMEGVNPNEQRRNNEAKGITLLAAYNAYIETKKIKESTATGYKSLMDNYAEELYSTPLKEITRPVISSLHNGIESAAQANGLMRVIRAIFNFARNEYLTDEGVSLFPDNPVEILTHRNQWHKAKRKQDHLRKEEVGLFKKALEEVRSDATITEQSVCDAMLFALLTGLRKEEVLSLRWDDINERSNFYTITETKNSNPLELPITKHLSTVIKRCKERSQTAYVFGAENVYGRIKEPKKVVAKVKKISGVEACNFHDLRRTFITTAEHLSIGQYTIKRLSNHALGTDVTDGYKILTSETLREPSNKIQETIMSL